MHKGKLIFGILGALILVELFAHQIATRFFLSERFPKLPDFVDVTLLGLMSTPLVNWFVNCARRSDSQRETLTMAVEQAAESIIITDAKGTIIYVNPAFEQITGYSREKVLGQNPRILKSGRHSGEFYEDLWKTLSAGKVWSGDIINKRQDGTLWQEETTISPVRDEKGRVLHFVAVKRDVTKERAGVEERARLNLQIAKQREQLESIMAHIPGVVWEAWGQPDELNTGYVSPYVETLLGYGVSEWLSTPNFWLSIVDPEDQKEVAAKASEHFRSGKGGRLEFRWIAKDGRRVWVEAQASVITDDQGKPIGMRGVTIDITARKTLEAEFHQAQKMEAIGTLAGGVAHDFNNLLTVINGYCDLALSGMKPGDSAFHKIEEVRKAGTRAASLTRQLLAFSRRQAVQPVPLDLNFVIGGTEKMLRRLIGENIELRTALDPQIGNIKADAGQIEQIVMNLAVNARDAMPQGGRLTIQTKRVAQDEKDLVLLSVTDTGAGMDAKTRDRIFEPFFTTKESGTGLGLSTVYGIVQRSSGSIAVHSKEGEGATFNIFFPLEHQKVQAGGASTHSVESGNGGGTILLAEDDESVRKLVLSMLEESGYRVLAAANAQEAASLSASYAAPIDLLLTDIIMPGGNGIGLAERLTRERPDLSVLFMSGYTDNQAVDKAAQEGRLALIQKPFEPRMLANKIHEILSRRIEAAAS